MAQYDSLEIYSLKAELCKTFADPKRLMILNELRDGEKSVGEIAGSIGLGQAIVSRQLGILREKGVLKYRREGTTVYYRIADTKIIEACDLVHTILVNRIEENREVINGLVNNRH
jgi:ArsR family transcriptional regulator, virulence genes transcriptional regulator